MDCGWHIHPLEMIDMVGEIAEGREIFPDTEIKKTKQFNLREKFSGSRDMTPHHGGGGLEENTGGTRSDEW